MQNMDWYNSLIRPRISPPNWIFAPMWTILYILIIISFLIFLKESAFKPKIFPLIIFGIQIFLNLSWSPVFFGARNIKGAFYIVCALCVFICINIYAFFKISHLAGLLLVPYFLWVSFATYLNYQFLKLNG